MPASMSARSTHTATAESGVACRSSSTSGCSADAASVSAGSASRSAAGSGGSSRHPVADAATVRPLTACTHTRTFVSTRTASVGHSSPTGSDSGPSACAGSVSAKLTRSVASFASGGGENVHAPAAGASSEGTAFKPSASGGPRNRTGLGKPSAERNLMTCTTTTCRSPTVTSARTSAVTSGRYGCQVSATRASPRSPFPVTAATAFGTFPSAPGTAASGAPHAAGRSPSHPRTVP